MGVGALRVPADRHAPVEDAPRPAVEDALVELAARAARRGVVDERVVVDVLAAVEHVEAGQRAAGTRGGEADAEVVAGERAAHRDRARRERAVAPLDDRGRAHVERALALLLDLVMLEDRALVEDDLGDGVRQVGIVREADVALDDGRLACAIGHEEVARLREHGPRRRRRHEEQVDRRRHPHAGRDVHEGAVLDEGGAEGGEAMTGALRRRVAAEVPIEHRRVRAEGLGETRHPDPAGQRGRR